MSDLRKHQKEWEEAKIASRCPRPREAREALFLSVSQFCELLGISRDDYFEMESGSKELSFSNKLFLVEAIRIAREKGLISDKGLDD